MRNIKVVGFGATYTRGFMVITDVILLLPRRSFRPAPISQNDSVVEHIWVIWWMIYNATTFVANNILYYNLNSVVLHFSGEPQYSFPFLSFINDETVQVGEIFLMEDSALYPVESKSWWWCIIDARSQGISSHLIDLALPEIIGFSTRIVKRVWFKPLSFQPYLIDNVQILQMNVLPFVNFSPTYCL